MQLISKDFNFNGKHALMVDKLQQSGLFEYLWQIFVTAPLVGFIYKRKGEPDTGEKKTIFLGQLTPRYDIIHFIYKTILLADNINEESPKARIDKAFKNINTEAATTDEHLFLLYLLGGIEVLYEKLIDKSTDITNNLNGFLDEIQIPDNSVVNEMGIDL